MMMIYEEDRQEDHGIILQRKLTCSLVQDKLLHELCSLYTKSPFGDTFLVHQIDKVHRSCFSVSYKCNFREI